MKKDKNSKLFNYENETNKNKINRKRKNKLKEQKTTNSSFDFNNEIIIGLQRLDNNIEQKKKKMQKKDKITKKPVNNRKSHKKIKETKNEVARISKKKKQEINKIEKKKKKAKNDVSINNTSEQDIIIETKKENKKQKNNKITKIVAIVILFIISIIIILMSPLFNIKQIEITGNEKITENEILSLSQISKDSNTYRVNLNKVKKKILKNAYIENVEIKRKLPNKILINVKERKATFMIEFGGGYVYINNQGYVLETSQTKLDVPIIQGAETIVENITPGERLCVNDLEKMTTVIKIMQEAENNNEEEVNADKLITRIDIENKQNYKIVFESEQKVAYIGDSTKLDTKMTWIKKILKKESGVGGEIFFNITPNSDTPVFRQSV